MRKLLLFVISFFTINAFGQLTVTLNDSALLLAQKIAGTGNTVSNASLNCSGNASGTFVYSGTYLGINKGILLSTGSDTTVANPGSVNSSATNNHDYTDPNLTAIEPTAFHDACILEFDIIPSYNKVSLTFCFGSEEYPEYVGASYNDAFGFFLTGPNPAGGTYNALNIGVLPNSVPVSINNVNAGTNSAYFYDNYSSPNSDIVYDGYTIPITTSVSVTSGANYHLKIAIADGGDEINDSGIFIRDSVFSSCTNPPSVTFTTLGFADTVCTGSGTYTLTGGVPSGGAYFGSGVNGVVFDATTAGSGPHSIVYTITDTSTNCAGSATHTVFVQNCSTFIRESAHAQVTLFPNPCHENFNISGLKTSGSVEIINALGEKLISQKLAGASDLIHVKNLAPGIYECRLLAENGTLHRIKFVKE